VLAGGRGVAGLGAFGGASSQAGAGAASEVLTVWQIRYPAGG
jgi:hypothetical protein